MNLIILGSVVLVASPLLTVVMMLYISYAQSKNLALYDEYENLIRSVFTYGVVIIPLLAVLLMILGVSSL